LNRRCPAVGQFHAAAESEHFAERLNEDLDILGRFYSTADDTWLFGLASVQLEVVEFPS
jgi:hypothetical protein